MESIYIKVPVTVKAKLTEKLRSKLLKELEDGINQAELELQQLGAQEKRIMQDTENNEVTPAAIQHINHIRQERQRRIDYREQALNRKDELRQFSEGAEIVQGTLERQVEIRVGDDMRELMNVEILVEDDKIIAIRG